MKSTLLIMFSAVLLAKGLMAYSRPAEKVPVLAGLSGLREIGAQVLMQDSSLDVGYAILSEREQTDLSKHMHAKGKCAGFEVLPTDSIRGVQDAFLALTMHAKRDLAYMESRHSLFALQVKPEIVRALSEVLPGNIQDTTHWLASFPSRYNKLPDPNRHVNELETKLKLMLKDFKGQWSVDQISHQSTRQKSLRVHLRGTKRPSEIVVMGGHLDSINMWDSDHAPGADDNASGSASLVEALRLAAVKGPFERSIEVFFYAGEESGLLGSSEIARRYKAEGKDVIAVLQLDMTLHPGSGELVIASEEDFTSAWLRDYLVAMNSAYIRAKIVTDKCGYACSDHASWYRQGYATLMPFESKMDGMNENIHTENDKIDSGSSFTHAAAFTKIAVVMAMDLGNSTQRDPATLAR